MKIRYGFVSNSSASSFVCNLCGYSIDGWSDDYDDDHRVCDEYGHELCGSCANNAQLIKDNYDGDDFWDEYETSDTILSKNCPLCQMIKFKNDELVKFFLQQEQISREHLIQKLKSTFGTYEQFRKFIDTGEVK